MNLAQSLMTQAEFAAHRGVKASAVSNWKKAGHLVFAEDATGRVLVDVARTTARLNARVDPTRGRPRSAKPEPSLPLAGRAPQAEEGSEDNLAEVRTELVREQITRERMRNAKEAGELAPVAEFERRAAEFGRQTRERVQAALGNIAERLAGESDPRKVTALLQAEVDRVFGDLADAVEAGALVEDDAETPGAEPAELAAE